MDEAEVTGYSSLLQWSDFADIKLKNKLFFYLYLPILNLYTSHVLQNYQWKCNLNFNSSAE